MKRRAFARIRPQSDSSSRWLALLSGIPMLACSGASNSTLPELGGTSSTAPANGGTSSSGGVTNSVSTGATGGVLSAAGGLSGLNTGGSTNSGSTPASGGVLNVATGGSKSAGGALSSGGASNATTGGIKAAGGASASGGAASTATGGARNTGGALASGGAPNTATGGAKATGGINGDMTGGTGAGTCNATNSGGNGFYVMERLNRGLAAVQVSGGVYVGWRMYGFEYVGSNVAYNLYRDGSRIASVTNSTNYQDASGTAQSQYTVRAVMNGVECGDSEAATPWAQNYLRVPISIPSSSSLGATYSANDASVGDLDGDGAYDLVLKWDPSDSKDNSQAGVTSDVYMDAYRLNGTRLWRINLGPNIRAGAHYTQFVVYDFDGDGRAEMALKTAPGTKDGTGQFLHLGPAANDDDSAVYRNTDGYVLSGPEYLTVFNGQTGAEMATVNFPVPRGTVSSWGDSYGNRVDRFLATAAYLDDTGLPSFIMARGYYTRTTLSAMNWRGGQLSQLWQFDSNKTPQDSSGHSYSGQGSHSMTVANVDSDPGQEVMYGAMAIDNNGSGLCSTGFNHGDAEHVGDLIPSRPGLEFFMCNEDGIHPAYHIRDARTCQIIQQGPVNGADTGRCVADDISATSAGAEMWASSVDGLLSATSNANVGTKPGSQNFLVWWDADETRELEDSNHIDKYDAGTLTRLLTASGVSSNNGTKSTPALTADLYGDWREEVVWRETDSSALRIYTTTAVTTRRIYTLMHDPQYRMQVSGEQTAYNQPPHTGFHIGSGMVTPPSPNIKVR